MLVLLSASSYDCIKTRLLDASECLTDEEVNSSFAVMQVSRSFHAPWISLIVEACYFFCGLEGIQWALHVDLHHMLIWLQWTHVSLCRPIRNVRHVLLTLLLQILCESQNANVALCSSFVGLENNLQAALACPVSSYRKILFAIHLPQHWILGRADPASSVLHLFDSMSQGATNVSQIPHCIVPSCSASTPSCISHISSAFLRDAL